jgi:hypothetical protein
MQKSYLKRKQKAVSRLPIIFHKLIDKADRFAGLSELSREVLLQKFPVLAYIFGAL